MMGSLCRPLVGPTCDAVSYVSLALERATLDPWVLCVLCTIGLVHRRGSFPLQINFEIIPNSEFRLSVGGITC